MSVKRKVTLAAGWPAFTTLMISKRMCGERIVAQRTPRVKRHNATDPSRSSRIASCRPFRPAPTAGSTATYRVRSPPDAIDARAQAIALEQSIEAPLAAVGECARAARSRRAGREHRRCRARHLRREHPARRRDDRLRSGTTPQHAVRQHVAARRCRARRCRISGFVRRAFRRSALRHCRYPQVDRCARQGAHVLGAEAARAARRRSSLRSRARSRARESTSSRTITASPIRHRHLSRERVRAVQRAIDDANRDTGGRSIYAPSLTGHYGQISDQLDNSARRRRAHDSRRADGERRRKPRRAGTRLRDTDRRTSGARRRHAHRAAAAARQAVPALRCGCHDLPERGWPVFVVGGSLLRASPTRRARHGMASRRCSPCRPAA